MRSASQFPFSQDLSRDACLLCGNLLWPVFQPLTLCNTSQETVTPGGGARWSPGSWKAGWSSDRTCFVSSRMLVPRSMFVTKKTAKQGTNNRPAQPQALPLELHEDNWQRISILRCTDFQNLPSLKLFVSYSQGCVIIGGTFCFSWWCLIMILS